LDADGGAWQLVASVPALEGEDVIDVLEREAGEQHEWTLPLAAVVLLLLNDVALVRRSGGRLSPVSVLDWQRCQPRVPWYGAAVDMDRANAALLDKLLDVNAPAKKGRKEKDVETVTTATTMDEDGEEESEEEEGDLGSVSDASEASEASEASSEGSILDDEEPEEAEAEPEPEPEAEAEADVDDDLESELEEDSDAEGEESEAEED
jgi:hypothetical protein